MTAFAKPGVLRRHVRLSPWRICSRPVVMTTIGKQAEDGPTWKEESPGAAPRAGRADVHVRCDETLLFRSEVPVGRGCWKYDSAGLDVSTATHCSVGTADLSSNLLWLRQPCTGCDRVKGNKY